MQRNSEWGYIPFQEMKEKNFESVTSFAGVTSITANFLNCRTIFFYAFRVNITEPHAHRIASSLQHTTQYAFLWLNQQAGKTNLKNTNIGDIKHKWEYFQSLQLF